VGLDIAICKRTNAIIKKFVDIFWKNIFHRQFKMASKIMRFQNDCLIVLNTAKRAGENSYDWSLLLNIS
jgi:hypothetical protein